MLSPCILRLLIQFILHIRLLTILEESVIVLRRLRMPSDNIVSLLHGIVQSSPSLVLLPNLQHLVSKHVSFDRSIVEPTEGSL